MSMYAEKFEVAILYEAAEILILAVYIQQLYASVSYNSVQASCIVWICACVQGRGVGVGVVELESEI